MNKLKLLIIGLILVAFVWVALSATLTIDIPNQDVPRIQEAYGSIYNLGRPATQVDIENAVRKWLKDSTQDYERRKNMAQFTPPPVSFTPVPTPTATAGELRTAPQKAALPTATPHKKR